MMFPLLFTLAAQAAPTPCHFVKTLNDKPVTFAYDIGQAYVSSALVVVGRAETYVVGKPQTVKVSKVIKGEPQAEIKLEGMHEAGTDPWGTAISTGKDTLLLLRGGVPYNWVDSGSGCPNSFEVLNGAAKIGKHSVKLEQLKTFFEKNPDPI